MAIHSREYLSGGDIVVVDCTHQSNVLVMDDLNFSAWKRGSQYRYHGGFATRFPTRVAVPHAASWNVVVEAPNGARCGIRFARR